MCKVALHKARRWWAAEPARLLAVRISSLLLVPCMAALSSELSSAPCRDEKWSQPNSRLGSRALGGDRQICTSDSARTLNTICATVCTPLHKRFKRAGDARGASPLTLLSGRATHVACSTHVFAEGHGQAQPASLFARAFQTYAHRGLNSQEWPVQISFLVAETRYTESPRIPTSSVPSS